MSRKYPISPLLITLCLLAGIGLFSQENEEKYVTIHPIKGIENPVTTCIFQDSQEFIWYGSLNGLYRWEGTKARHFNHIEGDTFSLPYDIIISILFEDEHQSLWISILGRGV